MRIFIFLNIIMFFTCLKLISNENIVGYYEADVGPHFLSIKLNKDFTFEIVDAGDLYPSRITFGEWKNINDSIISLSSSNQFEPIKEFGEIENDSIIIKIVDSLNYPIENANIIIYFNNSKILSFYSDSLGITKFKYNFQSIEKIIVYNDNHMFGNYFFPKKKFNQNILIKYLTTNGESVFKKLYYYYKNDTLICLGEKYEYNNSLDYLFFVRTNDLIEFIKFLGNHSNFFQEVTTTKLFENKLDSNQINIFLNFSSILKQYKKKINMLFKNNRKKLINFEETNLTFNEYWEKMTLIYDLYDTYRKKSSDEMNFDYLNEQINKFPIIIENIYIKLVEYTKNH